MNYPLYRSLHARGMTQAKLATLTGVNRSVLARILTNEPGRGKETRHKIIPHLTLAEIQMLGWQESFMETVLDLDSAGTVRPEFLPSTRLGPGFGGEIPMEQSSTSNIVPSGGVQ